MTTTTVAGREQADQAAYETWVGMDRNAGKAAKAAGIADSTFRAMIKRHQARIEQDDAGQDSQDAPEQDGESKPEPASRPRRGSRASRAAAKIEQDGAEPAKDEPGKDETDEPAGEPAAESEDEKKARKAAKRRERRQAKRAEQGEVEDDRFPEGVVSPVAFRHLLVSEGLADESLPRSRAYSWVKRPGFPVKHYGPDGTAHDSKQVVDGKTITKPGVIVADARIWYESEPGHGAHRATPVLYADGEPTERLRELVAGAEATVAEISVLFPCYAAESTGAATLAGFGEWLLTLTVEPAGE